MKKYLAVLRRPLFLVVVNFFLVNTLFSLLPFTLGNVAYNTGRIAIIFYAGLLVVERRIGSTWQAALAGAVIYFADHVLLKGGIFLLNYLFKPEGMGLAAFFGILVSFALFIPLAMLVGGIGGFVAAARQRK